MVHFEGKLLYLALGTKTFDWCGNMQPSSPSLLHRKTLHIQAWTFSLFLRGRWRGNSQCLVSCSLHPFSKLRDLPEKYSYFKCQFYVTKTAKNSKRKQDILNRI